MGGRAGGSSSTGGGEGSRASLSVSVGAVRSSDGSLLICNGNEE